MNLLRSSSWLISSSRCRDVGGLISTRAHLHVGGLEAEFFEQPLQDRVEPPGADVLRRLVHFEGIVGQRHRPRRP